MNKIEYFLNKHSSTILTVVGASGVVATAVLAVRATPKALRLIDEKKNELGENIILYADDEPYEVFQKGELTPLETIKVAWKPYIPSIIVGSATIACIFGSNYLNSKKQASLLSAYSILERSYKEYRKSITDLNEDEDKKAIHGIAETEFDEKIEIPEGEELFFEWHTMTWFTSTLEKVKEAERIFNSHYIQSGIACVNDYFDLLGIPRVDWGYQLGWFAHNIDNISNNSNYDEEFDFIYTRDMLQDETEYWTITMPYPPSCDYIC